MTPPMPRIFADSRLVIASHNRGKIPEIADLLAGRVAEITAASDHGVPEPAETEDSFLGNAQLKARAVAAATGLPALADDSGLSVIALGGAPGIHSARWAEGPDGRRDFGRGMARVHAALGDADDRSARFISALALAWPDGHCETVEGEIRGRVVWPPRGDQGFGYDPIFLPDGYDTTFGEMDPVAKHAISHRAVAFARLLAACFRP
jgi:XTP/dITP diphosphohydrolase